MSQKQISDGIFDVIFAPQQNHLDTNASWGGVMYETFGAELDYVEQVLTENPRRVWTIIDCGETSIVSSGLHFVNRIGYIITEQPCPEGEEIEVVDEDDRNFRESEGEIEAVTPSNHRVVWKIDVEAVNEVDAARKAIELMPTSSNDESLAKNFLVINAHHQKHLVELQSGGNFISEHLDGRLPYGIVIGTINGGAVISTSLVEQFQEADGWVREAGLASVNAIESLLLALSAEGVDIRTPKFGRAITAAVEAITNNSD